MSEREYKPNSYAYKERLKNAQEEKRVEKTKKIFFVNFRSLYIVYEYSKCLCR